MPIMLKIVLGIGTVIMGLGSICVTIAALFPPKEYKGDGGKFASNGLNKSIKDA